MIQEHVGVFLQVWNRPLGHHLSQRVGYKWKTFSPSFPATWTEAQCQSSPSQTPLEGRHPSFYLQSCFIQYTSLCTFASVSLLPFCPSISLMHVWTALYLLLLCASILLARVLVFMFEEILRKPRQGVFYCPHLSLGLALWPTLEEFPGVAKCM